MAVAFDAVSSGQTYSNVTSKTWTHTCSGSNRCVWVCVTFQGYPSYQTITAVSYDGIDITSSAFGYIEVDYGGPKLATVWYELKNPPTTANATVSVTFSGAVYGEAGSVSCTGVNQTTAHGTASTATASNVGTNPTVTVTGTTAGNLVLGGVHANPGGYTLTADQTSLWSVQERPGSGSWGSAEYTSAGGDKTLTWTYSPAAARYWSMSAFEAMAAASAPVNTVAPAVTGTVQVGQTLTTTDGTWTGSPTSYAYQWKRADNVGFTTNVTNIGTNQNTFVLTASESGKYVRCVVTATNAGGSTDANSNIVGDVLPAAPTNTVAPSCSPSSGTTADLFVFSSGTWTGSPTSWDWEYRTAGSGAWSALSGVQDPTIAGSVFGVGSWNTRVTATNAGGSTTANGTTITVTQPVPVNTVAPAVTPTSGSVGEVFSCTTGTWTNSPTGYSYQWKLDGANVGTNSNTYTPVASGSLTCTVTASNAGGAGTPAVSNTATVTAAGGVAILGGGFFS